MSSIMVPGEDFAAVSKENSFTVRARESEGNALAQFSLDDVWVRVWVCVHGQLRGQSVKEYTHMAPERSIDWIHVQLQMFPFIKSTYLVKTLADHKAMVLQMDPSDGLEGQARYRFPVEFRPMKRWCSVHRRR